MNHRLIDAFKEGFKEALELYAVIIAAPFFAIRDFLRRTEKRKHA